METVQEVKMKKVRSIDTFHDWLFYVSRLTSVHRIEEFYLRALIVRGDFKCKC